MVTLIQSAISNDSYKKLEKRVLDSNKSQYKVIQEILEGVLNGRTPENQNRLSTGTTPETKREPTKLSKTSIPEGELGE